VESLGVWFAALITLSLYSFVYGDNPAYRTAEHIYVGLAGGYGMVMQIYNYILPKLKGDMIGAGKWWLVFPFIIGLTMYARYFKNIAWLARICIGFEVGVGAGIVLSRDFKAFYLTQLTATFVPLNNINNILFVAAVVCTLCYFFFTVKHTGPVGGAARLGRWVMMVAFGAAFGNTVMARVSLFLGRVQFLLQDWLKVI